ncbi:MAG: response regulator, partial [Dehalococcoidia bacterium]
AIRSLIKTMLTKDGHTVEETGEPEEVLPKLEQGAYDIIFLDIHMPGMNGIELYETIIQKQPEMTGKVIFVTGDTSSHDIRDYLIQHRLSYINKPFDQATLKIRVNEIQTNIQIEKNDSAT